MYTHVLLENGLDLLHDGLLAVENSIYVRKMKSTYMVSCTMGACTTCVRNVWSTSRDGAMYCSGMGALGHIQKE